MDTVLSNQSVKDKIRIYETHEALGENVLLENPMTQSLDFIPVGDDCAAIPDGNNGYLLFAAEGIISDFIENDPWFAGYCAVMVNISDICAMGGLPIALTDTLWVKSKEASEEIWAGMKAACDQYGVPIVGGHTCYRSKNSCLSVSITGKAGENLLTSYHAKPSDSLLMVVDLNGAYYKEYPFFDASTTSASKKVRKNMRLLYQMAERKLSKAAKDISMGGIIGTMAMFLRTSKLGATISVDRIPKPYGVTWEKWLVSFPSFGYLIAANPDDVAEIRTHFNQSDIECEEIGYFNEEKNLHLSFEEHQLIVNYA